MKKLIFYSLCMLISLSVFAQNEPYYLLRGSERNMDAVNVIVNAQNNTPYSIRYQYDETMGNKYKLSLVGGSLYGFNCESIFDISNTLGNEIRIQNTNPTTAISINDVCPQQAKSISTVIRCGSQLQQKIITQPCNCPKDKEIIPTISDEVVFIDDVNRQPGLLTNSYPNLTQTWSLEDLNKTIQVDTRTWIQKNGWWFYPLTILVTTTLVEGLSDGEWFDWHNKPFAKEGGGGAGNSGGNVDHNPNAFDYNSRGLRLRF